MNRKKILIVMDPGILIPVKGYGGIERIIEMLALEYAANGHEVHLLITTGSALPGCYVHGVGKEGFPPKKSDARKAVPVIWKFLWKHRNDFDLIHNFGRLLYLLPVLGSPVKKIMSYQREISWGNIKWITRLPHQYLYFTGCSQNLVNRNYLPGNWQAVHNACNFNKYTLQKQIDLDAPLVFLGRIERVKGCHTAIAVAKASNNSLIIAGNLSTLPEEIDYYETEIRPLIDGKQVKYIGIVNDEQKNELLGSSKALLFPIEWNEPFGIVMIESMACGTPVIAFNHGSVNEVIDDGITGFKVNDQAGMIGAIHHLTKISRERCRSRAIERFDIRVIAKVYLQIATSPAKSVVIASTHQPAANPRALKEYKTLKEKGYQVKFLYAYNFSWSHNIDQEKFKKGLLCRNDFVEVGGNPYNRRLRYFSSRVTHRVLRFIAAFLPVFNKMSTARTAPALWSQVKRYPADLYIAHYLGALPGTVRAAKKHGAKLIFDAEDFHRGEELYYKGQVENVVKVEDKLLPAVNLITTSSPMISAEYKELYPSQSIYTINNVFSKEFLQPLKEQPASTLRLFWFSQHIGIYRGLEVFIEALNLLKGLDISLTIMANVLFKDYQQELIALSDDPGKITFKEPVAPEQVFTVAAGYDIGLAGEVPICLNKELCLSNKIFTYMLAGNAILASDVRGQRLLMEHFPGMGFTYSCESAQDLAAKIKLLFDDRQLLQNSKAKALEYASISLNWEKEKEYWLTVVNSLLIDDTGKPQSPLEENSSYHHRPAFL